MFSLKNRALASAAILLMLTLFACIYLATASPRLTSDAQAAEKPSSAFVMSVKLKNPNMEQPDGNATDTVEVLVSNSGRAQSLKFKLWRQDSDMRVAPVILRVDGSAKLYSPKDGQWRVRMSRDSSKMFTFTVRSAGADKYCAQDKFGKVCTSDPEAHITTLG